MILEDLIVSLEKKYNINLMEKWDNSGLIIGKKENNISKILICLDITNDIIKQAVDNKVDLIISHHPLIFSEIKKINSNSILGNKILNLIENNIAVYSIHTNADSAVDGLNDFILKKIGLHGKVEILFKSESGDSIVGGLGRIVELEKETEILEVINRIKEKLGLEKFRMVGTNKKIKKIAVVTGAGGSLISALDKSIDLYITGDLKHHESLDAFEEGLTLIDLGHFESEVIFSELIKEDLESFFEGTIIRAVEKHVFEYV